MNANYNNYQHFLVNPATTNSQKQPNWVWTHSLPRYPVNRDEFPASAIKQQQHPAVAAVAATAAAAISAGQQQQPVQMNLNIPPPPLPFDLEKLQPHPPHQLGLQLQQSGGGAFVCDICEKTFNRRNNLLDHVKTVHQRTKEFKCQDCEKLFNRKSNLVKHIRTIHAGEKKFICDYCEKAFAKKYNLEVHTKSVHQDLKEFECYICYKRFARDSNLLKHIKIHVNSAAKFCKCPKCEIDIAFPDKASLEAHIKDMHTGRLKYKCHLCERQFAKMNFLSEHLKEHDSDFVNKLKCNFCNKSFGRNFSLNTHIKTVHRGIKDFSCHNCEKNFTRKSSLSTHIRKCHPNAPNDDDNNEDEKL